MAGAAALAITYETKEERQARLMKSVQAENRRLSSENRRLSEERRMMRENPVAQLLRDLTEVQEGYTLSYEDAAHCLDQVPRLGRADVLKEYVLGAAVSKATALRLASLLPRYDRASTMSWIARQ